MTEDEAIALFTRASDVKPCDTCGAMPMWATARGPRGLAQRIHLMTFLVRTELFDEVPVGRHGRWTDVPLECVTADAIMVGLDGYDVGDAMDIRCRRCSRQYRQQWVTERGAEAWIVSRR